MAKASANSSTYPRTGRVRTTMIRTGTSAPPFESFRVLITLPTIHTGKSAPPLESSQTSTSLRMLLNGTRRRRFRQRTTVVSQSQASWQELPPQGRAGFMPTPRGSKSLEE